MPARSQAPKPSPTLEALARNTAEEIDRSALLGERLQEEIDAMETLILAALRTALKGEP